MICSHTQAEQLKTVARLVWRLEIILSDIPEIRRFLSARSSIPAQAGSG